MNTMTINSKKFVWLLVLAATLAGIISSQIARFYLSFIPPRSGMETQEILPALMIREISYVFLFGFSLFLAVKNRQALTMAVLAVFFIALYLLKQMVFNGEVGNAISGIRVIVIMGCFYSVYMAVVESDGWVERAVGNLVKLLIVFYLFVSIYQAANFPAAYGSTYFGSRVNGVYDNPILFSMTVAAMALFIFYSRSKYKTAWLFVCLFITLLTGGRAGTLVSMLLFMLSIMPNNISRKVWVLSLFLVPAIFIVVSDSMLSGREGTESVFKDGRLLLWVEIINNSISQGVVPVFMGTGLGDGTNASFRNVGDVSYLVSDSAFLMLFRSFGLLGVVAYVLVFFLLYKKFGNKSIPLLLTLIVFSLAQSLPELHPAFLIVLVAIPLVKKFGNTEDFQVDKVAYENTTSNFQY